MSDELLAAALACIKSGVSIIPIDHETKRPATHLLPGGKWKPYQSAIADEATVRRWFAAGVQAFAAVCGRASGGLLVLDFDADGFYDRWVAAVGELADGLPVQRTGGGGYQVFLRCESPGQNDKLGWTPDEAEATGRTIAIETRAEGGYAIVPPSLHPSGNVYGWLKRADFPDVPRVSQARADALLAAARKLDKAPLTRQQMEQREADARREAAKKPASTEKPNVIEAWNKAHSIEAALGQYGYTRTADGRYKRPGGKSASVSVKDGKSFHHSTNDPLSDGKPHDAFDFFKVYEHGGDEKKAIAAAAESLGINAKQAKTAGATPTAGAVESWPVPQPLPSGLPPVQQFDFALLPEPFRAWIVDIAERMQCPPDYLAATAMIAATTLIGRKIAIAPKRYDDWHVIPNLWGAMIGRPSLLKSPAMKEVLAPLRRLEAAADAEYYEAAKQAEAAEMVREAHHKAKVAKLNKAAKSGGDVAAIAAELQAESGEEPKWKRYVTSNTTVEKLGEILRDNPDGILVFSDELNGFLRSMEREGHESDRAFYLTAWSGDSRYTYDRIGRGTITIEAACVSIVGSIQPGILRDYLRQAVAGGTGDDGLMQRFQLAVWPDAPKGWRNVDRYPDPEAKRIALEAFQRLDALNGGKVAAMPGGSSTAAPYLRFSAAAQRRFDVWREELEIRLRSSSDHPAMESHVAKFRSLIPSLALIIFLVEGGTGEVSEDALERAIKWGEYLESHASRIYSSVIDLASAAATELAGRIVKGEISDGFAAREVYRRGWSGLDRESVEAAIEVLISLDWLSERQVETGGRTKTVYVINPRIEIKKSHGGEPTEPTEAPSGSDVSDHNRENADSVPDEQARPTTEPEAQGEWEL